MAQAEGCNCVNYLCLQKTLKYICNLLKWHLARVYIPYCMAWDTSGLTNQNNPKLNFSGTRRGWPWMPILQTLDSFIPWFPPSSSQLFFFFNFPLIASPYPLVPPINTYQPYHWYSGLENRVATSQQPVFKSLPSSITARMPPKS